MPKPYRTTFAAILCCFAVAMPLWAGDSAGDGAYSLQAALNAGGVVRIPSGTYALQAGLTITRDDTTVECESGAMLQVNGFAGALLTIRGADRVVVEGCGFDGAGAGRNGNVLLLVDGAKDLLLSANTIRGTVAGMYAVLLKDVTGAQVDGNRLEAIQGPGISVTDGSSYIEITDNTVDATASTNGALSGAAIEAKARAASTADLHNIVITGNTVRIANGFCFEAGQFGGTGLVSNVKISDGNRCQVVSLPGASEHCGSATGAKACGGYSLSGVSDSEMIGNSYDAADQAVDIAAIEMVACRRCIANANILRGDTSATATGSSGISLSCSGCTISGNQVTYLGPVQSNALIDLHTIPSFLAVDGNTITGNTLALPTGGAGIKGVYVNCNHAGGSASGTLIAGNTISGAAGTGQGIALAANGGGCALADSQVVANTMSNLGTGLLVYRATRITYVLNRLTSITTPLLDNGGSSFVSK